MARTRSDSLLLGEWACLGILAQAPAHGYDVAMRLAPTGNVGRVWSLSRSLTYRALDQLGQRNLIAPIAEEKGKAGGVRTILAPTKEGRAAVKRWLREPVGHIRDVRGELLLKLVLSEDPQSLLEAQRAHFAPVVEALTTTGDARQPATDPVAVWRYESSRAVLRFIDRMLAEQPAR
jgi:DNA-binding PadR family transcriptional regulator